jgi:uncharacterized membrane protein
MPDTRMQPLQLSLATQLSYAVHLLFAGLWVGAALFVTWAVVPLAGASDIGVESARSIADKFAWIARAGAVVTLVTGGHMAATVYGSAGLLNTTNGHLVLSMVALWVVLIAVSEVAVSRFTGALDDRKVRTAAADSRAFFRVASVAGVGLLLLGGYLSV